ncbi:hypothetical protein MA20_10855 [Bradyrhizobium japonicum]|uniref:Uncharacterized protein n=1 Tax=Bradyrhizobium japonicum TaxID=375 RepID=A0A0A3XZ50_BRAJP|nr:hypothetical protein MA20_10855 [Bradyrhizobium japonicum]
MPPVVAIRTIRLSGIGWVPAAQLLSCLEALERDMWNLLVMTALRGDGLRPELKELFDRLRADLYADTFVRSDGMLQSGPDPKSATSHEKKKPPPKRAA